MKYITEKIRRDFCTKKRATGKTQAELSKELGLNQSILSRFLSGKRSVCATSLDKIWSYLYGKNFPWLILTEDGFAVHDWEEHQACASKAGERSGKARKAAQQRCHHLQEPWGQK